MYIIVGFSNNFLSNRYNVGGRTVWDVQEKPSCAVNVMSHEKAIFKSKHLCLSACFQANLFR